MSCREEFVKIPSAGFELAGVLHLPIGATKPKPVLFLHGFTGNKVEAGRIYTDMARVLCAAGYASLRFDFRCHGDSPLSFEEYRISYAIEDARNAANFLKNLTSIDNSRFAIIGLSMGGGVAVNLAANRDDIAALVLLSPALDWPELTSTLSQWKVEGDYVYMSPPGSPSPRLYRMKINCATEMMKFSVMGLAELIKAPTLIIHAIDDIVIPISQARRFFERLKAEKKFIEIEHGGHVFEDYDTRRRIEKEILDWIKQYF